MEDFKHGVAVGRLLTFVAIPFGCSVVHWINNLSMVLQCVGLIKNILSFIYFDSARVR